MNEARKTIMAGIETIAAPLLQKAEQQGDTRIAPLVEKLRAALAAKPDSYFVEKLYPTAGSMDAAASQKVWREVAAEVGK